MTDIEILGLIAVGVVGLALIGVTLAWLRVEQRAAKLLAENKRLKASIKQDHAAVQDAVRAPDA